MKTNFLRIIQNGKIFLPKFSTFFFFTILIFCSKFIKTDNVGGSLMSLASPTESNSNSLFSNPLQDQIDKNNALNDLIDKNGNLKEF